MEEPRLEWTVHLARRRPRQAVAIVAVIVLAGIAAGYGFQAPLLGVLAVILLTASVSEFLFPVRYALGPDGASAKGLLHRRAMAWRQVRRAARDEWGVKLSPLARPSRLEAYRGIYLWFEGNAEDVMAAIDHRVRREADGGDDVSPG